VESATGPATVVLHPEHGKADLEVLCRLRPDDGQTGSCGAVESAPIYFLYLDLWHSSWLLERKNECGLMFLSFFIPVGVFLLMAARRPSEHRSMIALAAWWNISHGVVMAIQTVEAWIHSVHRNFTDVIVFLVIGVVMLALLPAKPEAVAPGVA
jgi:hypothetical protein